jgi:teichuronic acid biosynthesis glycosyltransferase TuaG
VTSDPQHDVDISVIVPAFRAKATIKRALMSVASQTLKPTEIIVVDDGSEDGTFEIAEACRDNLSEIQLKVFRQNNQGAGAARNRAIDEARCEIIAFLDADDEWLPEKLELGLNCLLSGNHLLTAHNGWIEEDGEETYLDIASRFRAAGPDPFHGLYRRGFISTSSVMARRSAVLDVGGFDETLAVGQDFDLWLKILGRPGASFKVFDQALTRYHITPGSITSQVTKRLACTLEIARRHAPILASHNGFTILSLCFRIVAVHGEALRANLKNGDHFDCLKTLGSLGYHLGKSPIELLFSMTPVEGATENGRKLSAPTHSFLWIWVGLVTAGYLYQFRALTTPILNLLGVK